MYYLVNKEIVTKNYKIIIVYYVFIGKSIMRQGISVIIKKICILVKI